ncbi:MAG: outer membrane protein assembly factor BamD [Acidobacteria bacterium]|nr:outer membrane protein assembly factor BamD [Acidobacteriota bacterium]
MKRKFLAIIFTVLSIGIISAHAQRNVTPAIDRDPLMEQDAKHNLDVAKQYFLLKKAYKGVLERFEETYAAYPTFSKMDEFLYYAGMSSYYLSENKGKQKIDLKREKDPAKYEPTKLKDDAIGYLSTIIEKYPESKFKNDAEKTLTVLKK